jgi:hypothetical protein
VDRPARRFRIDEMAGVVAHVGHDLGEPEPEHLGEDEQAEELEHSPPERPAATAQRADRRAHGTRLPVVAERCRPGAQQRRRQDDSRYQ